jgi:hypothetical protein
MAANRRSDLIAVAEPGEVPPRSSLLRRPLEPDALSADGVVA